MIDLGHHLDITVIAEGVETRETLDMLRMLGCDAIQGYYVSKPQPAENIIDEFDRRNLSRPTVNQPRKVSSHPI